MAKRRRTGQNENSDPPPSTTSVTETTESRAGASRPPLQALQSTPARLPRSTLILSGKRRLQHQNGHEKTPKIPSYPVYKAPKSPFKKQKLTGSDAPTHPKAATPLQARNPPMTAEWEAATRALLGDEGGLRDFQKAVTIAVLARKDVSPIAPTGIGKSLAFVIPLVFLQVRDLIGSLYFLRQRTSTRVSSTIFIRGGGLIVGPVLKQQSMVFLPYL